MLSLRVVFLALLFGSVLDLLAITFEEPIWVVHDLSVHVSALQKPSGLLDRHFSERRKERRKTERERERECG